MTSISVCPACSSTELIPYLTCKDYTVSHETFSLSKCKKCELVITTPQPEISALPEYYKSDEYISHSGKTKGISKLYHLARLINLRSKRRLIQKYSEPGTVLDYGCGTGEFLAELKNNGWEVHGVEPSDIARKKASDVTGTDIAQNLTEYLNKQFDVITLWHVLEHVPDLNDTLQKLLSLMKAGSTIIIAVPNYQSPDSKNYKEQWAAYDVPRHLWHFNKKSMHCLLSKYGANIVEIKPMKLDSYYVSILSEKYKRGSISLTGILSGLYQGMLSNLAAKRDNYSSLIYIVKKS